MNTASATLPKSLAVIALCWSSLLPVQAQAQESKIAWISSERIYNESRLAKLASAKLAEEFRSREKAVQELAARFKVANEALEKDMPTLSEAERAKRQRELGWSPPAMSFRLPTHAVLHGAGACHGNPGRAGC